MKALALLLALVATAAVATPKVYTCTDPDKAGQIGQLLPNVPWPNCVAYTPQDPDVTQTVLVMIDGVPTWQLVTEVAQTASVFTDTVLPGTTANWWPFTSLSWAWQAPTDTTGVVGVGWSVPTENADHTPLTDLVGFIVNYGKGAFTNSIRINNPNVYATVISGLDRGEYQFQIIAVNSAGVLSDPSATVKYTVRFAGPTDGKIEDRKPQ